MKDSYDKDLLELFLVSHCSLFIGSSSGPSSLAGIWHKPVFRINVLPYAVLRHPGTPSMSIPKLLYRNGCVLSIKEIFKSNYHWFLNDDDYVNDNIFYESNAPEDILDDFIEFFRCYIQLEFKMKNILENSDEINSFKKLCPNNSADYNAITHIPRNFFKKHSLLI